MLTTLAEITVTNGQLGTALGALTILLGIYAKVTGVKKNLAEEIITKIKAEAQPNVQHIGGQPIEVRPALEAASKAAFEDHKKEIWTVINGIRRDITEARADIAAVRVAREENGNRLREISSDVSAMSKTLHELEGEMKQVAINVNQAAAKANEAAATAQAALVEAQHKGKS